MKLHHTSDIEAHQITSYGEGFVAVDGVVYEKNILVTSSIVSPWQVESFATLSEADFANLLLLEPAVVLLGTGRTLRFPHPRLTQALTQRQIGVEVMEIGAACRTFNILVAEGRQVAMAIVHC